jgi:hypothetical protein
MSLDEVLADLERWSAAVLYRPADLSDWTLDTALVVLVDDPAAPDHTHKLNVRLARAAAAGTAVTGAREAPA